MKYSLILLCTGVWLASCNNTNDGAKTSPMDTTAYNCNLTIEQMIMTCPVTAAGDSLIICKQGTINVLGNGGGVMTWPEYMASKFSGAEGTVMDCKTGKALFTGLRFAPLLTYKNNKLLVDKKLSFEIYDNVTGEWHYQIELPVWRATISAKQGSVNVSPDSLIFKPVFHDRRAFASADSTYKAEMSRTDHNMYMRTADRLLPCALSGDTLSERRFVNLEKDLAGFFTGHPEYKKYLDEKMDVYKAYKEYLGKGGKRVYFDLTVFSYFYEQQKMQGKNPPPPRTTLKPVDE